MAKINEKIVTKLIIKKVDNGFVVENNLSNTTFVYGDTYDLKEHFFSKIMDILEDAKTNSEFTFELFFQEMPNFPKE